ncbi:hypothetical protein DOE51_18180 [Bdellovibrio sp. NC01]|nr:hypothetical protein DOE51_18180 [Bdellovibrio sp. NC01]
MHLTNNVLKNATLKDQDVHTYMCKSPAQAVCVDVTSVMGDKIKKEGLTSAIAELRKKYPTLPQNFDGTDSALDQLSAELNKTKVKNDLLLLADKAYRTIYDYDKDVIEATELARKLLISEVEQSKLSDENKKTYIGALNTTVVMPITEVFENEYLGKETVSVLVASACTGSGQKEFTYSNLPNGGPNGVIFMCPGTLLRGAGKAKEERIQRLVFLLAHELTHQMQFKGLASDDAYACQQNTLPNKSAEYFKSRQQEANADIWATRVLMRQLKSVTDAKVKMQKVVQSLNWLCTIQDSDDSEKAYYFTNKTRIENVFKLKETEEQIACGGSAPRC